MPPTLVAIVCLCWIPILPWFAYVAVPTQPILLVDDSHDDLFILKRLLTRAGVKNAFISFDHARDCAHFLESALRTPETNLVPAAIFCDKAMPEFDGFDLLQWVRSQSPLAKLPFILLSSVIEPIDRKRSEKLAATAFVEKFPAPHVLTQILEPSPRKAGMARS